MLGNMSVMELKAPKTFRVRKAIPDDPEKLLSGHVFKTSKHLHLHLHLHVPALGKVPF